MAKATKRPVTGPRAINARVWRAANGRLRTIAFTIDRRADIGPQLIEARAADFSWRQLMVLFGKSRSVLAEHLVRAQREAAAARRRVRQKVP